MHTRHDVRRVVIASDLSAVALAKAEAKQSHFC